MKIKIFQTIEEYKANEDFNYDFFVVYFAIEQKPNHLVPILRLFKSFEEAKTIGYSTFAATNGWTYKDTFPRCDDDQIEKFCKDYLDANIDLLSIPPKLQKHDVIFLLTPFIKKRGDICKECPHNINNICELCGCELLKKIKYKKESCPINKWTAQDNIVRQLDFVDRALMNMNNNTSGAGCGCTKQ